MGGKFHLKLNTGERPIANKYREGKMKRTLKRELKVPEIASMESIETGDLWRGSGGDFRKDLPLTSLSQKSTPVTSPVIDCGEGR